MLSIKDLVPDYNPTLLIYLYKLPLNNLFQLSNFNPYTLPIGYNSYVTLDSALVIPDSNSKTPLVSQGS